MLFLPITLEVLSTWRRRAGGLNPQERRILRDTFFSSHEKALISRAYHRKLVDLGEEGVCDEDMLFRLVTEGAL